MAVDVIAPVVVAVHVNRNGPVDVVGTVDETTPWAGDHGYWLDL